MWLFWVFEETEVKSEREAGNRRRLMQTDQIGVCFYEYIDDQFDTRWVLEIYKELDQCWLFDSSSDNSVA